MCNNNFNHTDNHDFTLWNSTKADITFCDNPLFQNSQLQPYMNHIGYKHVSL